MYEITVEESFDAAHCIRGYAGSCERLHGHTYRVRARFRFASLEASGMAIDFREARRILKAVLDYMDHQYINELPEFSIQNPTAENLARFIYERVRPECARLHSVSVWETANSFATYWEEE